MGSHEPDPPCRAFTFCSRTVETLKLSKDAVVEHGLFGFARFAVR
jgi:hypothetical protein